MSSPSDRNLLFGVIALQMEFITQAGHTQLNRG